MVVAWMDRGVVLSSTGEDGIWNIVLWNVTEKDMSSRPSFNSCCGFTTY